MKKPINDEDFDFNQDFEIRRRNKKPRMDKISKKN